MVMARSGRLCLGAQQAGLCPQLCQGQVARCPHCLLPAKQAAACCLNFAESKDLELDSVYGCVMTAQSPVIYSLRDFLGYQYIEAFPTKTANQLP